MYDKVKHVMAVPVSVKIERPYVAKPKPKPVL
jgi:hypothetical protein